MRIDFRAVKNRMREVAARYVEVPRNRKVKCYWHPDGSPSLHIYDDGFKCFACGESGDVVDWVSRLEGVSAAEALRMIDQGAASSTSTGEVQPQYSPRQEVWEEYPGAAGLPEHAFYGTPSDRYCYLRGGNVIGWVYRWDTPDGKKIIRPVTSCRNTKTGEIDWRWVSFARPRPLFRTTCKTNVWVLVEGEKAAQYLRVNGIEAGTWPGGAEAWRYADWTLVQTRRVILWPDNDKPGLAAMAGIRERLAEQGIDVYQVDVSDLPEGADAADLEIPACLERLRAALAQSNPETSEDKTVTQNISDSAPFKALGYQGKNFYFMQRDRQIVLDMTANTMTKSALLGLAPLDWWLERYPQPRGGWEVEKAQSDLITACTDRGVYSAERQRGRGIWCDDGRIVYHAGDSLIVNGEASRLADLETDYTYQIAPSLYRPGRALTAREAERYILSTIRVPSWQEPYYGDLTAGWVFCSLLAGVLRWRPSLWIQGAAGTGKTSILNNFISRLLGPMAENPLGSSTEAGIRQSLKDDARAVIIDEAEPGDEQDVRRFKNILQLMRQSSSDTDGRVLRGTASGEAQSYHVRAPFCFGSIQSSLNLAADRDRVTRVSLQSVRAGELTQAQADATYQAWKAALAAWPEDLPNRLLGRAIALAPRAVETARVVGNAMRPMVGSQREADQLGALLAGAYMLQSDEIPDDAQAQAWVGRYSWSAINDPSAESDADRALAALLGLVTQDSAGGRASVSDRITELAANRNPDATHSRALAWLGLRLMSDGKLFVSITSENRAAALRGTAWASDLIGLMRQLQGTTDTTQRLDASGVRKGVLITLPD